MIRHGPRRHARDRCPIGRPAARRPRRRSSPARPAASASASPGRWPRPAPTSMLNGFGERRGHRPPARRAGGGVAASPSAHSGADMSRPEQIEAMVAEAAARLGAVDILVNNAGIQHVAPIESSRRTSGTRSWRINLSAAFHTMRAAIPGMKARGWGRIVNVASAHGLVASPFKSAYVAAKHGAGRPDQGRGARARRDRRHLQRHLPGLCLDAAGREADRRPGQVARHRRATR